MSDPKRLAAVGGLHVQGARSLTGAVLIEGCVAAGRRLCGGLDFAL